MTHDHASKDIHPAGDNHPGDDLSARLDGQADDPARVEAHLAECAECAHRFRELKTVSDAVKGLPGPTVSDAFALRIAARIRRPAPRLRYWPAASGLLAAAATIVIIAAVVLSLRQPAPILTTTRAEDISPAGESALVADILLGADASPLDYGFPVPGDTPEISPEELILALSASGWFEDAAEAWEAETDIDELVQSLDQTQQMEFKRLLRTYEEGAQI